MELFIIQTKIVDHPEYETYVSASVDFETADRFVQKRLEQEIIDCGDDEEVYVTKIDENKWCYQDGENGLTVYFITRTNTLD